MKFRSLRGHSPAVDFPTAVLQGLAPDGGLYVPEHMPRISGNFLESDPAALTFADAGTAVLGPFLEEIPTADLHAILASAWTWPVPLRRLNERLFLLEEFHGPTLAFKDVGARFMASVLSYFGKRDHRRLTILVATSGDTGSAVAHGFHGADGIDVFVLYPSGKVSPLQEAQMTTLGGNVHAVEVSGTFDDCQALVKQALADRDLAERRALTTANSINLGRLLPQIAFYAWAWVQWRSKSKVRD